jgi:hypothetical protein
MCASATDTAREDSVSITNQSVGVRWQVWPAGQAFTLLFNVRVQLAPTTAAYTWSMSILQLIFR